MDEQFVSNWAGAHSLPDVALPDVPLPHVPLPHVPLPNFALQKVLLPNDPVPEEHPDGSVGEESNSLHFAGEAMIVAFGLRSGSCLGCILCSNLFISHIEYYTRCEVFGLLRVCSIHGFCISFILVIVLWDIAHAVFLQLLACKKPPCDGIEAQ